VKFSSSSRHITLLGDVLTCMAEVPDESIDLVYADPPYFLSNGGVTCSSGKMVSVDKGLWDKESDVSRIFTFNYRWLELCRTKLKPNGTIFVSGTFHNIYAVGFALQLLGYKVLNDIAWFKVNPPPNLSCRYFTHATEQIIWARKSSNSKHYFNYELMKAADDPKPNKQMLSLWRIPPPRASEKTFGRHPTQKPLALLERIVLAASKPGDTILDPFLGSGTTAVAALKHGRKVIGIDNCEEYLRISDLRISTFL